MTRGGTPNNTRPRITVKYAQTLDGKIATAAGHSQWISGIESRVLAHRLRAEHDAVLVGVGTVIVDDPQLTVRYLAGPNPRRIVLDSRLRIPIEANLVTDGGSTTVITTCGADDPQSQNLRRQGVQVITAPADSGRIDVAVALHLLADEGIQSILVEGGNSVITAMFAARLVDEVVVFVAPKIIGSGLEAVGDLGAERMADGISFTGMRWEHVGDDVIFRGRPVWPEQLSSH
ncbi:MAG: RibD family protein [Chloroflexota bacterium]